MGNEIIFAMEQMKIMIHTWKSVYVCVCVCLHEKRKINTEYTYAVLDCVYFKLTC